MKFNLCFKLEIEKLFQGSFDIGNGYCFSFADRPHSDPRTVQFYASTLHFKSFGPSTCMYDRSVWSLWGPPLDFRTWTFSHRLLSVFWTVQFMASSLIPSYRPVYHHFDWKPSTLDPKPSTFDRKRSLGSHQTPFWYGNPRHLVQL